MNECCFSERLFYFWKNRLDRNMDIVAEAFKASAKRPDLCHHCSIGLVALEASFHREGGRFSEAKEILNRAQNQFGAVCHRDLYWTYEKGQECLSVGRISDAMRWFEVSIELALQTENGVFSMVNRLNALVCSETLGFKNSEELEILEKDILSNSKPLSTIEALVYENLVYIKLQKSLRTGRTEALADIFQAFCGHATHGSGQVDFYMQWARELPHFFGHKEKNSDYKQMVGFSKRPVYQGAYAYRLRTISGFTHPDDAFLDSAVDLCNRLYLWVWRWLDQPNSVDTQALWELLKKAYARGLEAKISLEDRLLIRNSLGWLALLSGSSLSLLEKFEAPLNAVSFRCAPWFELEWALIRYLFVVRDANSQDARKAKNYLSSCLEKIESKESKLVKIVMGVLSTKEKGVTTLQEIDMINDLFPVQSCAKRGIEINIWKLSVLENGHNKEYSEQMIRALGLLCTETRIESERFAEFIFGIRRFQYGVHESKISSLLSRIRKSFGYLGSFEYKESLVSLKIERGIQVSVVGSKSLFQNPPKLDELLPMRRVSESGSRESTKETATTVVLKKGDFIRRREIETLTQKSRSATGRYVASLTAAGVLRRSGKGRTSMYQVVRDWSISNESHM